MSSTRRLVFSIIEFLSSECQSRSDDERDSLEVVIECLERVYEVSLANALDKAELHVETPLTEIFKSATKTARPLPSNEEKEKAEALKTQGNNLMKEGKYNDAIGCYNEAVERDWTNAVYLCNRAAAYTKLNRHDEAIKDCEEALEIDPTYGKAYGRKGAAYMALEKYQEAKDCFEKAKELDPDNELYSASWKAADEKWKESREKGSQGGQTAGPSIINSLFSNPAIMNMASQFMANPQMQQMMSSMMSGFGGLSGSSQANTGGDASSTPDPPDTTEASESATSEEATSNSGTGGFSNIFQFASQMAEQLEQSNPDLVNSLRNTMQQMGGRQNQNSEDSTQNEKQ